MSDAQMWALVAGFVSATFILPVIQQPRWPSSLRALVTLIWCMLVALVSTYLGGGFLGVHDGRSWAAAALTVFVGAITGYKGFAQPIGIAPAIERATSAGAGAHRPAVP